MHRKLTENALALLHYQNMDVRRPDILLKNVFFNLKKFHDFLDRTKKHMESDAAVKRLAWRASPGLEEGEADRVRGFWIQLEEPSDRPNEQESTFRDFMDENVREVYESAVLDADEPARQRRQDRHKFSNEHKIEVWDRDPETAQLLLARRPASGQLLLRPNTLTLSRQIKALEALRDAPSSFHQPLLRLMESVNHARWPAVEPRTLEMAGWMVLTDCQRPGTDEQRHFVQVAMATPDFAFLEGPPGSGKTTAICELILQLAKQGKRVLLCASTHVAVDNVLERLMDERNAHRDLMIPVRIGERRNVSEKARGWQLEHFVKTERERLLKHLDGRRASSESQDALLQAIRRGPGAIERMVLDASNLVCGTTIGILQHPDLKKNGQTSVSFDVMIIDEASKTTFQEFLVPALLAKRWIIVGDPRQLSPYVDDAATAVNIESCLKDTLLRDACVDTFMAAQADPRKRRVAAVVAASDRVHAVYAAQAAARRVAIAGVDADAGDALWSASIVVGPLAALERRADDLPLDTATVRNAGDALGVVRRRAEAWLRLAGRGREELPDWSSEVAWRLARVYEQRFTAAADGPDAKHRSTRQRLREQLAGLLPDAATGIDPEQVSTRIDSVRRVALPSILESLRHGFERDPGNRDDNALSVGLPSDTMAARHVLLSMQHRMHPEIASFSHKHIYACQALHTPPQMAAQRAWGYGRHDRRAVWLDVRGGFDGRYNANPVEAKAVLDELRAFDAWAAHNPRQDGRPWEAAVLTFYRGQEREIRGHLRSWTGHVNGMRHFARGGKRPHLAIDLCTVDRFQVTKPTSSSCRSPPRIQPVSWKVPTA